MAHIKTSRNRPKEPEDKVAKEEAAHKYSVEWQGIVKNTFNDDYVHCVVDENGKKIRRNFKEI